MTENELHEVPTDTPVAELHERGYAVTPDADLRCSCGVTLARNPDADVWRGEHRPECIEVAGEEGLGDVTERPGETVEAAAVSDNRPTITIRGLPGGRTRVHVDAHQARDQMRDVQLTPDVTATLTHSAHVAQLTCAEGVTLEVALAAVLAQLPVDVSRLEHLEERA